MNNQLEKPLTLIAANLCSITSSPVVLVLMVKDSVYTMPPTADWKRDVWHVTL